MPVSASDVWRVYMKATTGRVKGALIARKRGVNRRSSKVIERNRLIADKKPAKAAVTYCKNNYPKSLCQYKGKDNKWHCKITCFRRALIEVFKSEGLTKYSSAGVAVE